MIVTQSAPNARVNVHADLQTTNKPLGDVPVWGWQLATLRRSRNATVSKCDVFCIEDALIRGSGSVLRPELGAARQGFLVDEP